jgi:5-methylcytosine-specific restriction endonuclease McrA
MSLPPVLRAAILLRDGLACVYCEGSVSLEVDHVIPSAHDGPDEAENLVTACHACNAEKGVIHVQAFFLHRVLRGYPNTAGQEARVERARAAPVNMGAAYQALYGVGN